RLRALAAEQDHALQEAHRCWQDFERSVAARAAAWPDGQADRVRALVWYHMGKNAASVPDLSLVRKLPAYLRDHPDRPRPLDPSAEKCFQRSLELAPDQLETHRALFEHSRDRDQTPKAVKAARELLKRFPHHGPTLEALADLLMKKEDYAGAVDLYRQALRANPLERRLRDRLANAHLYHA